MRIFAKLFGLGCGVLVTAIAARYGFRTSDNDFDGAIWAFTYGAVTLGGLFGHALGVRAWRNSKLVGALVFAGSAFALLISLSNSIGAMAGRGNVQQAERMRVADIVRDARRSLKRAEDEREGLKFTPADEAAVQPRKPRRTPPRWTRKPRTGATMQQNKRRIPSASSAEKSVSKRKS